MSLIDIGAWHVKSEDQRPLSRFFNSAGAKEAIEYLQDTGHDQHSIAVRSGGHRSVPSNAKVHPLLAMEYLRWLDYSKFAKAVIATSRTHRTTATKITVPDTADESSTDTSE